jgi:hypothetical protein
MSYKCFHFQKRSIFIWKIYIYIDILSALAKTAWFNLFINFVGVRS